MMHTETRRQLRIQIETKQCELPGDEVSRLKELLDRLAEVVRDLPASLEMRIIFHPNSDRYHAEAAIHLPRRGLFTGEWDTYLDTAAQRCLRKLIHKAEEYQQEPDRDADERARNIEAMNRAIVAPQDPDNGPVAEAAAAQDYRRFRMLLAGYEDGLRLRVGRWVQRYPEIDAEIGHRISIVDIVEEIFLNAMERYEERPNHKTLREWLEDLIDPSLHAMWQKLDMCGRPIPSADTPPSCKNVRREKWRACSNRLQCMADAPGCVYATRRSRWREVLPAMRCTHIGRFGDWESAVCSLGMPVNRR